MWRILLAFVAFIVLIVVIGLSFAPRSTNVAPTDPQRLTINIQPGYFYGEGSGRALDVSPDGKKIVYVGTTLSGHRGLIVETIGKSAQVELKNTDGAVDPSFSPDGQYIVYYGHGSLRKVTLDGNSTEIARMLSPRGVSWLDDSTLLVGNTEGPLLRVSLNEGTISELTVSAGPQLPHLSPHVLPGGKAVLFTIANGPLSAARIGVANLEKGEERVLMTENAFAPRFVPTGHLVFARGGRRELMAVKFNPTTLEIEGAPQRVVESAILGRGTGGSTDYAVSSTGVLVYAPRQGEDIDDALAALGGVSLTQFHVHLGWFDELRRLVP